jgi:hypothetical protein
MRPEPNRLESDLQSRIIEYAIRRRWLCVKATTPSRRGWPDVVAIRNGRTVWIEVKRKDEEARRQQVLVAVEMREHGAEVFEVDTLDAAMEILR